MKNIDFITNSMIMHRGFFDNEKVVENTIKAFKKSNSLKHPYELDVRLTKDDKLVVFHDDNLKRLSNVDKMISDLTYEELKKIKLLKVDTIPLLEDVLKLDNKYGIIIEVKNEKNNRSLEDNLLDLLKDYNGEYAIISFNKKSLRYIKSKNKDISLGYLIGSKNNKLMNSLFIKSFKPDFLSVKKTEINNKYIQKFKKEKPVLIWTIKNRTDFNKYKNKASSLVLENINMI